MNMRTRKQENKYGQALGYAWGVKDYSTDTRDIVLDSAAFATYYSMVEDLGGFYQTLKAAYSYFRRLKGDEQEAYRTEWARRPWSVYEEDNV